MYEFPLRNLLEFPEKYQQSPFTGIDFLQNFKKSRSIVIEFLKKKEFEILNLEQILNNFECSQLSNFKEDNEIISNNLLQKLFYDVVNNNTQQEFFMYLNKFIKTFEINKKIFSRYNYDFKPASDQFDELLNYVLLSHVLLYSHSKLKNLKFLNSSLKLNDIISSQHEKLNDKIINSIFLQTLELEMSSILDLSKSKGVFW